MKNKIYEIEFNYGDEMEYHLGDKTRTHNAYILIYATGTPLGDTIQHALDCGNEDGDFSGLDKLLLKHYGLKDDDICFYFDRNGIEDESLILEIEHDFDIRIEDYWVARESDYE